MRWRLSLQRPRLHLSFILNRRGPLLSYLLLLLPPPTPHYSRTKPRRRHKKPRRSHRRHRRRSRRRRLSSTEMSSDEEEVVADRGRGRGRQVPRLIDPYSMRLPPATIDPAPVDPVFLWGHDQHRIDSV